MVWPEVFLPSAHRPHRFHRSHRPHKYHRPRDPTDLTGPTDTTDPTDPGLGFRGLNTDGHTLDGSQWGSSPLPLSPSIAIVLLGAPLFLPRNKEIPSGFSKAPQPPSQTSPELAAVPVGKRRDWGVSCLEAVPTPMPPVPQGHTVPHGLSPYLLALSI